MTEIMSGRNGLVQNMCRALYFGLRRLTRRTATVVVSSLVVSVVVCPVTHAATGCENEALRSTLGSAALPDCRAYEMVTPPYKEGYPLFAEGFASNGETAFVYGYASLARTPGVGESQEQLYLDTRTSSGWRLAPMNTALTEFVGQLPLAFEANSGETLWSQHTPSQPAQARMLYIRSASGAFSDVGPLNPVVPSSGGSDVIEPGPNNYTRPIGATRNYEHIVLRAPSPEDYWSFDLTKGAGGSLYEYSGTDNEHPILVGVTGAKGSNALLGECGSKLGSGGTGSAYNAVSASGEVIFFTVEPLHYTGCAASAPEFAEVYARLHGSRISSEEAETVDVSESECSEECGGESGKEFEGASESGEKVFFTSTQKLTNDASDLTAGGNAATEACAEEEGASKGCNLYLYDFARPLHERLTLVAGDGAEVLGVAGMAEDGARVYFVARGKSIAGVGSNEYDKFPLEGSPNLYVYDTDTGKTEFIATLVVQDREDWRSAFNHPVEVTGEDGRFVLFASSAQGVTPDDTGGPALEQLFEYNADGETGDPEVGELVRVTQGEDGYAENGNSVSEGVNLHSVASIAKALGSGADFKSSTNRLNVSVDGKTVVFQTVGALSPRALPASAKGCQSVYEFRSAGPISNGVVSLLSDGRDVQSNKGISCGAGFERMDASGDNVLFSSADELVSSDTDGFQRDVYDARVEGGFAPGPAGGELGLCLGGSCEGAVSGGGGLPGPGSSAPAEGNIGVGSASVQTKPKPKPKPKPKAKVKPKRKAKAKGKGKAKGRAGRGKGVGFVRVGG